MRCILSIEGRGGELVDVCVEAGELKGGDETREGGGRREREEGRELDENEAHYTSKHCRASGQARDQLCGYLVTHRGRKSPTLYEQSTNQRLKFKGRERSSSHPVGSSRRPEPSIDLIFSQFKVHGKIKMVEEIVSHQLSWI